MKTAIPVAALCVLMLAVSCATVPEQSENPARAAARKMPAPKTSSSPTTASLPSELPALPPPLPPEAAPAPVETASALAPGAVLASAQPPAQSAQPPARSAPASVPGAIPAPTPQHTPPEIVIPTYQLPQFIMGHGQKNAGQLASFLCAVNPQVKQEYALELAAYYREECSAEGVNSDVAFAQMCVETGFLRFGGLVTPEMNNFAGLGSIGPGQAGEHFPDTRTGVRAQVQHLKAYATPEKPKREIVDTRYRYVKYGSAPTVGGLAGTWAADKHYGVKIYDVLERLYSHK